MDKWESDQIILNLLLEKRRFTSKEAANIVQSVLGGEPPYAPDLITRLKNRKGYQLILISKLYRGTIYEFSRKMPMDIRDQLIEARCSSLKGGIHGRPCILGKYGYWEATDEIMDIGRDLAEKVNNEETERAT